MENQVDETTSEKNRQEPSTGLASSENINMFESKNEVAHASDLSEVTELRRSTRERKLTEKGRDYLLELKINIYEQTKCCLNDKLSCLKEGNIDATNITCEIEQLETLVKDFNHVSDELLKLLSPVQRESCIRECQTILSEWNHVKASSTLNSQIHEIDNIRLNQAPSLPDERKSVASSARTSSSILEKRLQARAKVAALQVKL